MRPSRKSIDRLKVLWLGSKDQTHAEEQPREFRAPKISVLEKGSCISTSHDDHNDCRQSVVLPYNTGPTHLNFILDVECTYP